MPWKNSGTCVCANAIPLGQGDPTVRFDKDGDAYVVAWVHVWEKGGRARYIGMLLHSRDGMQTWTVYDLPFAFAYFEKLDGHNTDCMKRPPVILLSESWSPTDNYLLIPEKQKDGTLRIPKPVLFAENAAGVGGHSGDGNMALTVGDKVFVTFAAMRPLDASPDEFVQKSRWEVRRKDGTQVPTPRCISAPMTSRRARSRSRFTWDRAATRSTRTTRRPSPSTARARSTRS